MLGIIGFEQHRIRCIIGVTEDERREGQDIYVDLKVKVDFSRCTASDSLQDTVSYIPLAEICTHQAQTNQYQLLETLANAILRRILSDPNIHWAWIRIKKPAAIPSAAYALVELEGF